mgnify:CR=1 FL=1
MEAIADARKEAVAVGARAILRDKLGFLAPSVNDETMAAAVRDAETVILAAERAGLIRIR